MEEIQIKEIIRVLIFSFSDGPGTPDWAEKNDIYQDFYQNHYDGFRLKKETDVYIENIIKGKYVPTSSTVCVSFCAKPVGLCISLKKK